ncbi:MAG TPA: acetylglutamate kinase [Cytophagales bacterium]|nr:acetylglutamate kinase [Cytophagales bacterium]
MEKVFVIKIGGNVVDNDNLLQFFLKKFANLPFKKVLIHGGGKIATEMSKQMGLEVKMVEGRRITDEATLKVITMVYGGLINKNIVGKLQSFNCNAIGLTGADGNLISSKKRPIKSGIDYGFVGDIELVNVDLLTTLLNANVSPVVAPISYEKKQGQLLNTNADTIASVLAIALSKFFNTHLIYCFEKKGVLRDVSDENSVIPEISHAAFQELKEAGAIFEGMIPKLDNAFQSMQSGVQALSIGHAENLEAMVNGEKSSCTQLLIK